MNRVLVTRAAEDAEGLVHLLARAGYEPVRAPLLLKRWRVDEVADAARSWPQVDWVLVTSPSTADVIAAAAPSGWKDAKFAAVGPSTAQRLETLGLRVDLVGERATGQALVDALGPVRGKQILYPRSKIASPGLAESLRSRGATVYEVIAYTNDEPPGFREDVLGALPVHATTLLSASAARRVAAAVPTERHQELGHIVTIGPSTQSACRLAGLPIHASAQPHTLNGLMEALRAVLPLP